MFNYLYLHLRSQLPAMAPKKYSDSYLRELTAKKSGSSVMNLDHLRVNSSFDI